MISHLLVMDEKYREILNHITFGVVPILEKKTGVTDVLISERVALENNAISTWELKNYCSLPDDLKSFYATTDGILIQWSIKFNGVFELGRIQINSITDLIDINTKHGELTSTEEPSLMDIDSEEFEYDLQGHCKPKLSDKSFVLDSCANCGKVCLSYKKDPDSRKTELPEIWLLDRALQWHFLASSFTHYFRLLITHLGIPGWQYQFISTGISPETRTWCSMFIPNETRILDQNLTIDPSINNIPILCNNIDFSRLFKHRNEKKKHPSEPQKTKNTSTKGKVPLSRPANKSLFKAFPK